MHFIACNKLAKKSQLETVLFIKRRQRWFNNIY